MVEPLVYGKTGGVSTVALLLAAIFWSWVWGPIGLMLSVPMTVVLAVLGKYVTALEPLWILLGDHAALPPHVRLYQRLLAGDSEEAAEVVEEFSRDHAPIEVCDQLFIPTLALLKRDRQRGQISETLAHSVHAMSQQLLDEYVEDNAPATEPAAADANGVRHLGVIGAPAAETGDELALEMLRRVVPADVDLKIVPLVTLASELIELVAERTPQAVCISALGPGGTGQTRYLCKRLRQRFPNIRVIVGRWGFEGEVARTAANLQSRARTRSSPRWPKRSTSWPARKCWKWPLPAPRCLIGDPFAPRPAVDRSSGRCQGVLRAPKSRRWPAKRARRCHNCAGEPMAMLELLIGSGVVVLVLHDVFQTVVVRATPAAGCAWRRTSFRCCGRFGGAGGCGVNLPGVGRTFWPPSPRSSS